MNTQDVMVIGANTFTGCVTLSDGTAHNSFDSIQVSHHYVPYVPPLVWPTIVNTVFTPYPDKQSQAFKIAALLIEKKLVDEMTVSKFIALVKDIAELL